MNERKAPGLMTEAEELALGMEPRATRDSGLHCYICNTHHADRFWGQEGCIDGLFVCPTCGAWFGAADFDAVMAIFPMKPDGAPTIGPVESYEFILHGKGGFKTHSGLWDSATRERISMEVSRQ